MYVSENGKYLHIKVAFAPSGSSFISTTDRDENLSHKTQYWYSEDHDFFPHLLLLTNPEW